MSAFASWSADGRFLLMDVASVAGNEVWVVATRGDKKPYPFLTGPGAKRLAHFSPAGHWVAYESLESGRAEIYIRPFPGPGAMADLDGRRRAATMATRRKGAVLDCA
jgi:Tol biopolymer transport system component